MGKQILVYYHGQIITIDEDLIYIPYFAKEKSDTVSKEDKDDKVLPVDTSE
jgi:hypothetical protein